MLDPVNSKSKHIIYVCYAQAKTIPQEIENWMETNPREQKMTTNVAKAINDSLLDNINFHELNRGILLSAESIDYDDQKKIATIVLSDPTKHGNIDGGHTLRAILEAQKSGQLSSDRYVFMEIFIGLETPVELVAARNTSVQVDLKSIEELKNSFEVIKKAFGTLPFETIKQVENLTVRIKEAFFSFLQTKQIPDIEVEDYSCKSLVENYKFTGIGALFLLDWLEKDEEAAEFFLMFV